MIMAKFCKKCGAPLEEGAMFCSGCGATLDSAPTPSPPAPPPVIASDSEAIPPPVIASDSEAIPPPAPPPAPVIASDSEAIPPPAPPAQPVYQQPAYQQPAYQQPAYAAAPAPPKKKFPLPIWLLIVIIVAVIVAVAIIVANIATGNVAGKDYFEMGPDQIPTVKQILGEERKVSSYNSSISNGIQTVTVVYKVEENQRGEMKTYAETLMNSHGFINTTDVNFDLSVASGYQFATESREEGFIILLDIDYDENGYTLMFTRGEGTLTRNVEEPVIEEEEAVEENQESELTVQITVPYVFEDHAIYDMEYYADEMGFIVEYNSDGSFTYYMTEEHQAWLMEDSKYQIESLFYDFVDDDMFPGLMEIEWDDESFDWVILRVTDEFFDEEGNWVLAILYIGWSAPMYQVYMGMGDRASTVISWVYWETDDYIDSVIAPDYLYTLYE